MGFSMTEYTLSTVQVYQAAVFFFLVLCAITLWGLTTLQKDVKRLAWNISLFNSGIMTLLGVYYLYFKISSDPQFFQMVPENLVHFEARTDYTSLVCLWFGMANVFDLAVGLVFYPKYLGLLTAYVHHGVFIWMMYASTTGDGIFMTVTPFAPAFCNMLIEELPTFLLALGSVFPAFRTDLGFGVTFFLLRIAFHSYFLAYAYVVKAEATELVLYSLTLLLHLNWFYSWVTKYGSKMVKAEKKKSI